MGGSARPKDILDRVETKLKLTDYEKEVYEKTRYVRWKTFVRYYAIDCTKTGLIQRAKGIWTLTPEGEKAIELSDDEFLRKISEGYRAWKKSRKANEQPPEIEESQANNITRQVNYQQAIETARTEIEEYMRSTTRKFRKKEKQLSRL